MLPERIIVTFTKEEPQAVRGISATDFNDSPVPLTAKELAALLPEMNLAAMARVGELEAQVATLTADHAVTVSELQAAVVALQPESEKQQAALAAEIAQKQATLDRLRNGAASVAAA